MKRKQIIQDIDKIWKEHFDNAINKEKKQRPIGNKIASYILKSFKKNCSCLPCGCNPEAKIWCEKHYMEGIV